MVSDRLKIAQVCWHYGPYHEGISRSVFVLSERLAVDHEVHVFAARFDGEEHDGLHFRRVRVPGWLGWFWVAGFALSSGRMVSKGQFDLVHVHVPCLTRAEVASCHFFPRVMTRWMRSLSGEAKQWLSPADLSPHKKVN